MIVVEISAVFVIYDAGDGDDAENGDDDDNNDDNCYGNTYSFPKMRSNLLLDSIMLNLAQVPSK